MGHMLRLLIQILRGEWTINLSFLSQLFCEIVYFSDNFVMKGISQKTTTNLFFVLVFNINTWKIFENTSNVLILHYPLIKANALHKIPVHLVFFSESIFQCTTCSDNKEMNSGKLGDSYRKKLLWKKTLL